MKLNMNGSEKDSVKKVLNDDKLQSLVEGVDNKADSSIAAELRYKRLRKRQIRILPGLIISTILFIITIISGVIKYDLFSTNDYNSNDKIIDIYENRTKEIREIILRGQDLLDQPGEDIWITQILSGQHELPDYMTRLFISPIYLANQVDDEQFVKDSYSVVFGQEITAEEKEESKLILQQNSSRLAWIDYLMKAAEIPGTLPDFASATQIRTLTMVSDLPEENERIIGLLPISAEIRLSGEEARLKLFSNGALQQSFSYDLIKQQQQIDQIKQDTANADVYTVYWDTRYETPGLHKIDYLIQTSDGRGQWVSLDSFIVPDVQPLEEGQISAQSIPGQSLEDQANRQENQINYINEAWFRLDVEDNIPMLTLFQADADLELTMFNIMGEQVAESISRENLSAALRYQGGEKDLLPLSLMNANQNEQPLLTENQTSYYVKISRSDKDQQTALHYSLAAAETVALTKEEPARYIAVIDNAEDQILIKDENDQNIWQPAENYSLIQIDSRLAALNLETSGGQPLAYAPSFNNDDNIYGLYVDSSTTNLAFDAWTIEGSAADLEITINYEDGTSVILESNDTIELAPSVNLLQLKISGFKGITNIYELSILRPPAENGYHEVLEAFPFTYRTPLWAIHLIQPQWQFIADNTGINWLDFMEAQDNRDKNLVDANYSPAHWVKEDSPVYDGVSWKAAATEVIAYFGDPRHALTPLDIFQFESLQFEDSLHTVEGVEAMLQGTFMSSDSQEIDYADLIYRAGQNANISPFFVAAKILQEMGPQGQSVLAHGELSGYEGIYNFYNIGSTPNPSVENGALINGARFAQFGKDPLTVELDEDEQRWLIPWNTPERAIKGGAVWIADRYVAIGQDTLYGQKFDLIADPDLFVRQYAQNIQMAWAEGRRTYRAYDELELLDQPFVFKIPVFDNLPEQFPVWP